MFTYKDISEKNSKYHTIEIQSIIPNLHITSRYYIDEKLTNDVKTIQLVRQDDVTLGDHPKVHNFSEITF